MPRSEVRIATRASALARWQAEHVAALIRSAHPDVSVELVAMTTEGDRRTDVPLAEIGGKGVFAKEVQAAVLDGRADLAVHSAKDLPAVTPDGLVIGAVPQRGDARDALVGNTLADLPAGAVVATGSQRRRVQLAHLRPDLRFAELRGNMATRLEKAADFDAIVVAAVALRRLGSEDRISDVLDPEVFVPQVAQGALAVECRSDDVARLELLARIDHRTSRRAVEAERAFLMELGGDCTLPAGAHALPIGNDRLHITGVLASSTIPAADPSGPTSSDVPALQRVSTEGKDPQRLGRELARTLLACIPPADTERAHLRRPEVGEG